MLEDRICVHICKIIEVRLCKLGESESTIGRNKGYGTGEYRGEAFALHMAGLI